MLLPKYTLEGDGDQQRVQNALLLKAINDCLAKKNLPEMQAILNQCYVELKGALSKDPANKELSAALESFNKIYLDFKGSKSADDFKFRIREYLPKEEPPISKNTSTDGDFFFQSIGHNFNDRLGLQVPFGPNLKRATLIQPNLTTVYYPGKTIYNLYDYPVIPNFEINKGGFGLQDWFERFPRPFPYLPGVRPRYVQATGRLDKVEGHTPNTSFIDLQASGIVNDEQKGMKGLTEWLDLNYARFTRYATERVDDRTRLELDLLFNHDGQKSGEALVILDENKRGAGRIYYNDGQGNWFNAGMVYEDGRPMPGSMFQGELNLNELKAATSYIRSGENDVFYTVVRLPSTGTTLYAEQTATRKKEVVGIQDISDKVSIQAGYFTIESGQFFGDNKNSTITGGSAGVVVKDVMSGKIYAGKEEDNWNLFGVEGRISKNTFVSYFQKRENDSPTHQNLEVSHTQSLGEGWKLSTSFRHRVSEGEQRGSGTMVLEAGDFTIGFAYDDINSADYWRTVNDYLKSASKIRDVRQLLDATRNYLNTNVLVNSNYPQVQLEIGQKGYGRLTISKDKNGGGTLSYTGPRGKDTFAISLSDVGSAKGIRLEDVGFTYVGDKAFFQIDKTRYTLGGKIEGININFTQSLVRMGAQLKGLYQPRDDQWGFGGVIGTMPTTTSPAGQLPQSTFFFGGIAQKDGRFIFDKSQIGFEILVHPNPGVYSFGAHFVGSQGGLSAGVGANILYMPEPSFGKKEPFDYRINFTLDYRW